MNPDEGRDADDRELLERLEGAPREAAPRRDLWPTIAERAGGFVAGPDRSAERRRRGWSAAFRAPVLLRAAAAAAIFAAGVWAGRQGAARPLAAPDPAPEAARYEIDYPPPSDPLGAAAEIQRAGSHYVGALARFGEISGAPETGPVRAQGYEAALSALQGAALELVKISAGDPEAARILYTVTEARSSAEGDEEGVSF